MNSVFIIGEVCAGHRDNVAAAGETVEEILQNLNDQFCGCTHVSGRIRIDMVDLTPNVSIPFTEDSFNFFYHLEQIYGTLFLGNIPTITSILFPNLRIIRGEELLGSSTFSVSLTNVNAGEVLFPKLTEISRGDVQVTGNPLCNMAVINWPDIIDNGEITAFSSCTSGMLWREGGREGGRGS